MPTNLFSKHDTDSMKSSLRTGKPIIKKDPGEDPGDMRPVLEKYDEDIKAEAEANYRKNKKANGPQLDPHTGMAIQSNKASLKAMQNKGVPARQEDLSTESDDEDDKD